jgi:hypothetical protein
MRVPIENGLGLINQVLDFIKLPALPEQSLCKRTLSEFYFSCGYIFILTKHMVHV